MNEHRLQLLIQKFWDGEASGQECAELLELLELEENEKSESALWPAGAAENHEDRLDPDRRDALLRNIALKISPSQGNEQGRRKILFIHALWFKRLSAAAALIVLVFVAKIFFDSFQGVPPKVEAPQKVALIRQYDTLINNGQTEKSFALPDQSSVLLAPNSQLYYEHGLASRRVILKGKARFTIKHDPDKVFTVTTGEIMTTDIGTVFEIDARKTDKITVRLLEGQVKVGKKPDSKLVMADQYLNKREALKIKLGSGRVVLERTPLTADKKPAVQPLVFNKTPLRLVFKKIATRYHCPIKFSEEDLEKLTFTGNVEPSDALPDILNIICTINNLSYTKNSDGFMIGKP